MFTDEEYVLLKKKFVDGKIKYICYILIYIN